MLTSAYIDDLQVHGSTPHAITGFDVGSPGPRAVSELRPNDHGASDDTRFYGPRTIEVTGRIVAANSEALWAAADALKAKLALGTWHVLKFRRAGLSYDERALVRVDSPVDMPLVMGTDRYIAWGVSLFSADPRLYSDTLTTSQYDPTDSGSGGLDFPLVFPISFNPTTVVRDEFNYVDGDLVGQGDWVTQVWGDASAQVSGGTVVTGVADGTWRAGEMATVFGPGRLTVTLTAAHTSRVLELYVLIQSPTITMGVCRVEVSQLTLGYYQNGGSFQTLATASYSIADGDRITVIWDETDLSVLVNGGLQATTAHSLGTGSGRVGFDAEASTLVMDDWTVGEDAPQGALVVENEGTIATPPTFTITGPVINPIIDNDTTGESIYTQDCELTAGATLVIDVANRTALLGGTTARPDLINVSLTDWFDLAPGQNILRLRGTGMSAAATELAVTFRSARI